MKRQFRNVPFGRTTGAAAGGNRGFRIPAKLAGVLFLSGLLALLWSFNGRLPSVKSRAGKKRTPVAATPWKAVREDLQQIFTAHSVPEDWLRRPQTNAAGFPEVWHIFFPPSFPVHELALDILNMAERRHLQIVSAYEKLKPCGLGITLAGADGSALQLLFREKKNLEWFPGRIAVIVDDFGYTLDRTTAAFLNVPFPITFAVIPGTDHDRQVAEKARNSGYDVLIHLPMEPLNGRVEHNGYTVFTNMSQSQIDRVVERARRRIPWAIGINNHMGSKATADRRTMARLMRALKRRGLIFVDSGTNPHSVAYALARQTGVPALRLTTYLDNPKSSQTLRQKLEEVVRALPEKHQAVVIGHARPETAKLLPQEMARWAFRGVKFVRLQDLLEEK